MRYGVREPVGRSVGYGDGKKVGAAVITSQYRVNTLLSDQLEQMFAETGGAGLFTKSPGPCGYQLLEGEVAFVVRGSGSMVLTALNGLDARFVSIFPNDPELVRQLLYEIIQPVGIVQEDPTTAKCAPVTLRTGGTHPLGAPHTYNFGAPETYGVPTDPTIAPGCAVVMDVPNLKNPIQFGNATTGADSRKIRLVPRALDKRKSSVRIMLIVGAVNHNPEKFRTALAEHDGVYHSWLGVAKAARRTAFTILLMGLDVLLEAGILQPTATATELAGANGAALPHEDVVVRLAEYLELFNSSSVAAAALSAEAKKKYKEVGYKAINRMLPSANPETQKYNAAHQFAFVIDRVNGTFASKARVNGNGKIKSDSIGKLFGLSINHWREFLEAITGCVYSESKNMLGVALTEPSVRGTSLFQMMLAPHGGMSDLKG